MFLVFFKELVGTMIIKYQLIKMENIFTCAQYRIKSCVPQIKVNHKSNISGITQLKYWFRNSNEGPKSDQSRYSISDFVIWAIYNFFIKKNN